jgi:hypothetical protein
MSTSSCQFCHPCAHKLLSTFGCPFGNAIEDLDRMIPAACGWAECFSFLSKFIDQLSLQQHSSTTNKGTIVDTLPKQQHKLVCYWSSFFQTWDAWHWLLWPIDPPIIMSGIPPDLLHITTSAQNYTKLCHFFLFSCMYVFWCFSVYIYSF